MKHRSVNLCLKEMAPYNSPGHQITLYLIYELLLPMHQPESLWQVEETVSDGTFTIPFYPP